ncbi:unnamed protein product [Boreogadus saida]
MNGDAVSASALGEQRLHFLFPEKRLKNRNCCRSARLQTTTPRPPQDPKTPTKTPTKTPPGPQNPHQDPQYHHQDPPRTPKPPPRPPRPPQDPKTPTKTPPGPQNPHQDPQDPLRTPKPPPRPPRPPQDPKTPTKTPQTPTKTPPGPLLPPRPLLAEGARRARDRPSRNEPAERPERAPAEAWGDLSIMDRFIFINGMLPFLLQTGTRQSRGLWEDKTPSSTMTATALPLTVLLCLLLACHLNGQQPRGSKCLCADKGANYVKGKVKNIEVFPADHSCHRVEILVTTASKRQCLDPASPRVRRLLTRWNKKNSKTAPPTVM